MAQTVALQAEERVGKARKIVREGFIPAVLYGHGFATVPIQLESRAFKKVWQQSGTTSLISLSIGKNEHQVLIREVQYHPVKGHPQHIDFYKVRMDEAIKASVPIVLEGIAPAVKDLSGVLLRNIDAVEVEALPKDLPHQISIDISVLVDFEKTIHVKDIKAPTGVKILANPEEVVALVQPPRSEEEIEKLSEEVKEDVEAVEGVKKEEKPAEGEEGAEQSEEQAPDKEKKE